MSTLKGHDDCTDIILDFIAGYEAGGNYNAVIGNSHASEDLGKKSIGDIYVLMDHLLASGKPSTAVGRYQIIRRTMQALQLVLGLDNKVLFTPDIQDRMAVRLLVGRGYPAWWRGQMTDVEFAHTMSCEWASLPDPELGGKSHYDGIGPNHAGTTLVHVYSCLSKARAARLKGASK